MSKRLGCVLVAVAAAAAVVVLAVEQSDDPSDFADHVADVLTKGGDEAFRSVFCESAEERASGVDVFTLIRPIKVTVDSVVDKSASRAKAVLVVDKAQDRVFIGMDKQPSWCVSEIHPCTTAASPTFDPPRLPCDGLLTASPQAAHRNRPHS